MNKDTDMTMQERLRWPTDYGAEFRKKAADHIDQLESALKTRNTDDMNDMVSLGVDRDSWKARAEQLEADKAELVDALDAARVVWREYAAPCNGYNNVSVSDIDELIAKHKAKP